MAVKLLEKDSWNLDLLNEVCDVMSNASICGFGQAAANPLSCAI